MMMRGGIVIFLVTVALDAQHLTDPIIFRWSESLDRPGANAFRCKLDFFTIRFSRVVNDHLQSGCPRSSS